MLSDKVGNIMKCPCMKTMSANADKVISAQANSTEWSYTQHDTRKQEQNIPELVKSQIIQLNTYQIFQSKGHIHRV